MWFLSKPVHYYAKHTHLELQSKLGWSNPFIPILWTKQGNLWSLIRVLSLVQSGFKYFQEGRFFRFSSSSAWPHSCKKILIFISNWNFLWCGLQPLPLFVCICEKCLALFPLHLLQSAEDRNEFPLSLLFSRLMKFNSPFVSYIPAF